MTMTDVDLDALASEVPTVEQVLAENDGDAVEMPEPGAILPNIRMGDLGGIPQVANFAFPTQPVSSDRNVNRVWSSFRELLEALPPEERAKVAWLGTTLVRVERRPNGRREVRDGVVYNRYVKRFRPIALSLELARRTGKADFWDGWSWVIGGRHHAKDHPANLGTQRGDEDYELVPASPQAQAAYAAARQKLTSPDMIAAATSAVKRGKEAKTIRKGGEGEA